MKDDEEMMRASFVEARELRATVLDFLGFHDEADAVRSIPTPYFQFKD